MPVAGLPGVVAPPPEEDLPDEEAQRTLDGFRPCAEALDDAEEPPEARMPGCKAL